MAYRLFVTIAILLVYSTTAYPHALGVSVLNLTEQENGSLFVDWQASDALLARISADEMGPIFSNHCSYDKPYLSCAAGSTVDVSLKNVPQNAQVIINFTTVNHVQDFTVMKGQHWLFVFGQHHSAGLSNFFNYIYIGIKHIIFGYDHLLFVFGLLLLIGFNRQLIYAITAFTLSHSLSLLFSVFGWVSVPIIPVEIVIALSIVLVAKEALNSEQTITKQWPWLVSFGFGFIHGLGFASALSEVGLPRNQELLSVLAFNVGVELGQLGVLLCVFVLLNALIRAKISHIQKKQVYIFCCYVIGVAGSYWCLERIIGMFTL